MATRRTRARGDGDTTPPTDAKGTAPRKRPAAKAPTAKTPRKRTAPAAKMAAPHEPPPETDDTGAAGASGLWRAGLKALDNVRQDVTRRHTNVIETLLGIAPARTDAEGKPAARAFPGLEGLGLRKFEDVFDQRVAAALERLGTPTREELQALDAKLDRLLAQLERLEGTAPKGGTRKR